MSAAAGYDAVVIGAGPAGSAAAAVLAERGRRVLLLEKDHFPRQKVCGEFLSGTARPSLERLGVRDIVEAGSERITGGSVHLASDRVVPFDLPTSAIGISRFRLDALLARQAQERGAASRFGTRVLDVNGSASSGFHISVSIGQREETLTARGVIGAWGRWDALDRSLQRGFLERPARFFGWSRDYVGPAENLAGAVRLYTFPGGYCGLSRVEGGAVNLAGVISERMRQRLPGGWEAVVAHARKANAALDGELSRLSEGPVGFLGTGPVFFTEKPPVESGILLAGDAAGVIDPFSGEGQAAALATGILAADTLERALRGEISFEGFSLLYADAWRRRFRRRFGWGKVFRRLMFSPALGTMASRLAGERTVRLAIARLTADR